MTTTDHAFRVYNTLTRKLEDFTPLQPGHIGLYVCGMTVYDHAHVGHARAMVVFDALVRYLGAHGWEVNFVRNFTDVDDKIIRRAAELGEEPMALAERYIASFREDTQALGLASPTHEPRVSTSIGSIIDMIAHLVDNGHAYVNEGTVWFAVDTFAEYGKLSGQKVDELKSADEVPGKRSGADFALWKAAKPGEPEWESPWGPGRPGWHIECSAMSREHLGAHFDIHGGGLDLVFPHHENEIAQSECGNKDHFANVWMHNGLLVVDDGAKMKGGVAADADDGPVKMGKSLGNVFNIRDALAAFPAEALRFYYLQAHYRSPLPWNGESSLPNALAQLMRLYEARERAEQMGGEGSADLIAREMGEAAQAVLEQGRGFVERYDAALAQDFNTPKALSYLFELARAINRFADAKKALKRGGPVVAPALAAFDHVRATLNLAAMDTRSFHEEVKHKRLAAMGLSVEAIDALMAERDTCRQERRWADADRVRDDLAERQILVMDTPEGSTWRLQLRGALPE